MKRAAFLQHRQPRPDQLVPVHARRRGGAVDRGERASVVVDDGNGQRDQPVIEFVLDRRVPAFAHLAEDALEFGLRGDRVLGERRECTVGEVARPHVIGFECEDRASHRGRVSRIARADARRQPHHPVGRDMHEIEHVGAAQHRERGTVAGLVAHGLEMRPHQFAETHGIEIGRGEAHHFGPEQELALMLGDIAELDQRVQATPRRCRRELGDGRHLAQRHLRMLAAERAQHRQSAVERREIFGVAVRFLGEIRLA